MSFSLKTRRTRGVVLLDMSGHLSAGESVVSLRKTVRQFAEEGRQKFVLNLEDISHFDSCGLGELVAA